MSKLIAVCKHILYYALGYSYSQEMKTFFFSIIVEKNQYYMLGALNRCCAVHDK